MRPAPGLTIEQQDERVVRRLLLCGEARGEQDAEGTLEAAAMAAVVFLPKNRRSRPRWKVQSEREIMLAPWQFSCFNANDPNREKLLGLWQTDPISWERADTVADLFERGLLVDPTGNATHYVTANLWNMETPEGKSVQWFHRSEIDSGRTHETARWGHHVFAIAP